MNVFILYFHPEPQSFNAALLETAVSTLASSGHVVRVSDLYKMNFNPVSGRHNFKKLNNKNYFKQQLEELSATEQGSFSSDIEDELQKLEWCDLMIWQFPLWWFGLPAAMKGWVDRVFAIGRTYGNGRFYDKGVFRGKKAILSITTGGEQEAYLQGGVHGDIYGILRPIHRGILEFVGFSVLKPNIAWGPAHIMEDERKTILENYAARLKKVNLEKPIKTGGYV